MMNSLENRREIYQEAVDKWGIESQVDMAIEEMAELTQVLLHVRRANKTVSFDKLASEIADVKILIEQLEMMYSCSDLVDGEMNTKLNKLRKYLDGNIEKEEKEHHEPSKRT